MPLGRGLIFYVSSILLMPTVKYLAISMLFFLTYFLLVGQKGGMVFISDFKKMENVYFMAHPSGWDIKYTFSLYYLNGNLARAGEVKFRSRLRP